jgi:hypothetical protein
MTMTIISVDIEMHDIFFYYIVMSSLKILMLFSFFTIEFSR